MSATAGERLDELVRRLPPMVTETGSQLVDDTLEVAELMHDLVRRVRAQVTVVAEYRRWAGIANDDDLSEALNASTHVDVAWDMLLLVKEWIDSIGDLAPSQRTLAEVAAISRRLDS